FTRLPYTTLFRSCGRATGTRRATAGPRPRSVALGPEGPEEARAVAGVAGAAALLVDEEEQGVAVAVVVGAAHELHLARRLALPPHLLAAAAPEHRPPLPQRQPEGLGVHPRHHQHLAGGGVLDDRRDQAALVEADALELLVDDGDVGRRAGHPAMLRPGPGGPELAAGLQVEARRGLGEAARGDRVHVALAQDDVVGPPDLDLVAVLRVEQHVVADLHRPHVGADGDHLAPRQAPGDLRGRGDEDAPLRLALPVGVVEAHEHTVVQHLDGELVALVVV